MNRQNSTCKSKHLISTSFLEQCDAEEASFEEVELCFEPFKEVVFLGISLLKYFKRFHITETSRMLDRMKNLGFKYSTRAGITIGISDIVVLPNKDEILDEAQSKVDNVLKQFRRGLNYGRRAL